MGKPPPKRFTTALSGILAMVLATSLQAAELKVIAGGSMTALLNALELDKTLYEVVYEARNRPAWLGIPTTAMARLSDGRRSDLRP